LLKNFLQNIFQKLQLIKEQFQPGGEVYTILKPCYRCVYAKRYEPVLIYSFTRGVRIIVNYKDSTYVRKGDCIGFNNCNYCLEKIDNPKLRYPCTWKKI